MKSPSKQAINRDIKTSMNLLLHNDNTLNLSNQNYNFRRLISGTSESICQ